VYRLQGARHLESKLCKTPAGSRFGDEAAAELTSDVRGLDDLELLERLFEQALTVDNLDEFRSALPAAGAAG
jgi:hypothetical protein